VEEVALLGDHADLVGERFKGDVAQVDAVDEDTPLVRVIQARNEVGQGSLSRPAGADERDELPRCGAEGNGLQGYLARLSLGHIRLAQCAFLSQARKGARVCLASRAAGRKAAFPARCRGRRRRSLFCFVREDRLDVFHAPRAVHLVKEELLLDGIAEGNILEDQLAGRGGQLQGAWFFADLKRQVDNLEDALETDHRGSKLDRGICQALQGSV